MVKEHTYINLFFFFNDTATTEIYTLSLHDALPISPNGARKHTCRAGKARRRGPARSEEHTSELQSRPHLVCRLLLEKKKKYNKRQKDLCRDSTMPERTVRLRKTTHAFQWSLRIRVA